MLHMKMLSDQSAPGKQTLKTHLVSDQQQQQQQQQHQQQQQQQSSSDFKQK